MNGVGTTRVPPRLWTNFAPPPLPELLLAVALLPLVLVVCVGLVLVWPICRVGAWYEGWCPDCLEPTFRCRCGGCDA